MSDDPLVEPQVCGHLADAEQGTGAGTWVVVRAGNLGEPEVMEWGEIVEATAKFAPWGNDNKMH